MKKLLFISVFLNYLVILSKPVGLYNEGNTCFMNASIQCIANIEPLSKFLLDPNNINFHSSKVFNSNRSILIPTVTQQYKKLLSCYRIASGPIKILPFCQTMWTAGNFTPRGQDDAMAFIELLINHLIDFDINKSSVKYYGYPYQQIPKTTIGDQFRFIVTQNDQCSVCANNTSRNNLETFLNVQIAGSSLVECLQAHFNPEFVSAANNKRCSQCNKATAGQRQYQILQAPAYLIIQLKRFAYDMHSQAFTKIPSTIKINVKDLSLKNYFHHSVKPKNCNYELISIVKHAGSLCGGHYWAYVKDETTNVWYNCNDATVKAVAQSEIDDLEKTGSSEAYILFYKNKSEPDTIASSSNSDLGPNLNKSNLMGTNLLNFLQAKQTRYVDLLNGISDNLTSTASLINEISEFVRDEFEPGSTLTEISAKAAKTGSVKLDCKANIAPSLAPKTKSNSNWVTQNLNQLSNNIARNYNRLSLW